MEKIKLAENLFLFKQTTEDKIRANTYLLKGNPNILIDAGFLIKDKIGLVLLTHCHFDHTDKVKEYQKKNVKVKASEKTAEELSKASYIVSPKKFREKWNTKPKPMKVNKILKENETITNGNFKLKIISAPGHTPGSIAFYEPNKKILFSGDVWYGDDFIGSWKHEGGDLKALKKSVAKLKKLNVKLLCPGHSREVKIKENNGNKKY